MKTASRIGGLACTLVSVLCLAGCHAKFDMEIALDEGLKETSGGKQPSVEVHLIPICNEQEYKALLETDVNAYWVEYSKTGKVPVGTRVVKLGADTAIAKIGQQDKMWADWDREKARNFMVLSNHPLPVGTDSERGRGPRRLVLPLDSNCWPKYHWDEHNLSIVIKPWPTGVQCLRAFDENLSAFPFDKALDQPLRLLRR